MSIVKTTLVLCDGCDLPMDDGTHGNDRTAVDVRQYARQHGGHCGLPGGRDICEDCWDEGKR